MRAIRLLIGILVMSSLPIATFSQFDPGTGLPAFGSFNKDSVDTINVGNLNIHFEFPVFEKKGRGLNFSASALFDNTPYRPTLPSCSGCSGPDNWSQTGNFWTVKVAGMGTLSYQTRGNSSSFGDPPCNLGSGNQPYTVFYNFSYIDSRGTSHPFSGFTVGYPTGCWPRQSGTANTLDGYLLNFAINGTSGAVVTQTVSAPTGNVQDFLAGTLSDPNGNAITLATSNTNPWTWTDTTAVTALTMHAVVGSQTFSYPNPAGGSSEQVTLTQSPFNLQTSYNCTNLPDLSTSGIYLTTGISLPDGTSYSIVWESTSGTYPSTTTTGRIHSLTLPSGATVTYTYTGGTNGINCQDGSPAILTKQTPDGTWTYNHFYTAASGVNGYWTTIVTDPQGNDSVYTFGALSNTLLPISSTYETSRLVYQGSHTSGTLLEQILTCYNGNYSSCASGLEGTYAAPQITQKDAYTYLPGLSPSLSETLYNGYGLPTNDNEFDFGVNTGSAPTTSPIRATMTSYATIGSTVIHDHPSCVEITAGPSPTTCGTVTGNTQALTNYLNYDSHGNLGTLQKWVSGSTYVSQTFTYTSAGLLNTATDFKQTTTTSYTYGTCNNSYPTVVTTAGLSQQMTWDCNGGALTSITDPNSQTTNYSYINPSNGVGDPFWRVTQVTYPDGGKTTTTYNDTASPINVATSQLTDNSGHAITTQTNFDSLGRPSQKALTSDPLGTDYTATTYDALGRTYQTYNPTRCNPPTTSCDTVTTNTYDALSRVTSIALPDTYSFVNTTYSGNCLTTTDPVGNARKACYDGLGRLTQVFEDPTGLNYETDYTYDALNNLQSVTQKGGTTNSTQWRTRSFAYDGLSRLTQAVNPESGTTTYTYDANDNLMSKTSPAPNQTGSATATITYCYDALNRLTAKGYSAQTCSGTPPSLPTPAAVFTYDVSSKDGYTNFQNTVGRLVKEQQFGFGSVQANIWFDYDAVGRIKHQFQCASINCGSYPGWWAVTNTYDLAGNLTTYQEPFGTTFAQKFDPAGRPWQLTSTYADTYHPQTLYTVGNSTQPNYSPAGQILSAQLGNGLTAAYSYTSRLQIECIGWNTGGQTVPACATSPSYAALSYFVDHNSGSPSNGNVTGWYGRGLQVFNRTYTYDTLNRLSGMLETRLIAEGCKPDSTTSQYSITWTYDAWGNRTAQTPNSGTCSFSQSASTKNQLSGYTYDAAGNIIGDGAHSYYYDAENHLTQVDGNIADCSTATACYLYYASGQRADKYLANGSTVYYYTYDTDGNVLTDTDKNGNWNETYFRLGGQLIGEYRGSWTGFFLKDQLGSTHADALFVPSGATPPSGCTVPSGMTYCVYDSYDYLPFGEKLSGGIATTNLFTDHEFDSEPGGPYNLPVNLYQTDARKYNPAMGRWMSPDPAGMFAVQLAYPQSLNRYSYVLNNPLNSVDPLGLDCVYLNDSGTGIENRDQQSSSDECGQTGGYWADGTVTDVAIGGDAQTVTLTATLNGADYAQTSYQQDATLNVGYYAGSGFNPYGHIAIGIGNGPRWGLYPYNNVGFGLRVAFDAAMIAGGPNCKVSPCDPLRDALTEITVSGRLVQEDPNTTLHHNYPIQITGMQATMIQQQINQTIQNPPPYSVFGSKPACDCGTWAQGAMSAAGIQSGPPAPLPPDLMQQLVQIYGPR